ncbi:MAG: hypothetical protein KA229_06885 [Chitinophagaceae bacterium]|nr:hypothetical protein [Chitinophagaceae bacterium]
MRKMLFVICLILANMILYSCKGDKNAGKNPDTLKNTDTSATCCYNYCDPSAGVLRGDIPGVINGDVAALLSRLYNADYGKNFICQGTVITKEEDASSIVFDLATLKKYIAYIEGNVCRNNCLKDSLELGIRFYYGKYPAVDVMKTTVGLENVPSEFANRHTLFMIPVFRYLYSGEEYVNFNPMAVTRECKLTGDNSTRSPVPLFIINGPTGTENDQNHGSLRPPPQGSGAYPEQ